MASKRRNFKMTQQLRFILSGIVLFAWLSTPIQAATEQQAQPAELVKRVFAEFSKDVLSNEALYANDSQKLEALADKRLSPYFNFRRMTQIAMARFWRQATKEQRAELIKAFKAQLLRSYSKTLYSYRRSVPEVLDEQVLSDKRRILKVKVESDKGESVQLFLRFEKHPQGWQIVDVNVDGVSVVIVARGQFSEKIAQSGIDGLIESIRKENQQAKQ